MGNRIELEQRSEEWKNFRRSKIGASEAPILLGISPYKTKYELYLEKVYDIKKPGNAAMQMGNDKEEEARKWASQELESKFIPVVEQSSEFPFIIASLDGMSDKRICLEIKWNKREYHEMAKLGKIVDHHNAQIQTQYLVTNSLMIYYVSCWQSEKILIPIKRDDDLIQDIIISSSEFYYENLGKSLAPELCERDYESVMDFDGDIKEAYDRYKKCQKERKIAEDHEVILRDMLIKMMGERNAKTEFCKLTKYEKKGSVDYSAIELLKDIDLEKYRKPSTWQYKIT